MSEFNHMQVAGLLVLEQFFLWENAKKRETSLHITKGSLVRTTLSLLCEAKGLA